jgi:N-ethylmaleimide reductase
MGPFELGNRMVMAPMTRSRADNEAHQVNDLIVEYYKQRASAGLIITEGIFVSEAAAGYIHVPGIYTRVQTESWKAVTAAVHERKGKIFAQLWHTGRISHPDFHQGRLPLAPSAINPHVKSFTTHGFQSTVTPAAMSLADIKQTVSDFKQAAKNAMEAGFDGVELHAANGYLFHQFFATCSNVREDQYGGTIANRSRFLFDVLDALRDVIDYSRVGVRLHPGLDDAFGITSDETTLPTFDYIIQQLNDYPLAYLHLSGFSKSEPANPMEAVLEVANRYREIYKGVLMINRGFDALAANQAILGGVADLVSFGVPFIANPDLPLRYRFGLPLNEIDRETFYTQGARGFTDYPFYPGGFD